MIARPHPAAPPWRPRQAAVCTAFPLATEAGIELLRSGGNAVDAAVAAAWALAVCEPSGSGVGGQTTVLLRTADGIVRVIDGHSHAPRSVCEETVSFAQQQRGHRSCVIPSTPATLERVHGAFGRARRPDVLAPAIRIAEEGFPLTPLQAKQARWVAPALRENRAAADFFLRDGQPPPAGHQLRQPQLAAALRRLAAHGAEDFYRGGMARDIAEDMAAHGGLMDLEDLAAFAGPVERAPVSAPFRGLDVLTAPPPGGGLHLLLALRLLERLLPTGAASDAEWYEAIALATFGAFRARERAFVLPDELTPELERRLLGDGRVAELVAELRGEARLEGVDVEEPGDTTHLTAADAEGNVVALTQSIQSVFGAKVANPKLGFVYNNYLRTCPRTPHPARLGPNCLSRSNASPVFLMARDGGERVPVLAMGSAGSRRITSSLLQVASRVVDRGMNVQEAIDSPRVHALLSGKAWVEDRVSPAAVERLARRFSPVVRKGAYSFAMAAVHALHFSEERTTTGADPRRDGAGRVMGGTVEA